MSDLNKIFFNEYAKLDKLCCQLYSTLPRNEIKGVTNYIDDMKNTPSHVSRTVPGWDNSLSMLIHLRHMRNHLAHEPDAFNEALCTHNDIDWVHYFYDSIMAGTDPISQSTKKAKAQTTSKNTPDKHRLTKKQKRTIKRTIRSVIKFLLRRF